MLALKGFTDCYHFREFFLANNIFSIKYTLKAISIHAKLNEKYPITVFSASLNQIV